jgi:hypothetical protein
MAQRTVPDRFVVAFSFSGEQRDLVRSIANEVERLVGRSKVFFDEWYEFYVAGSHADTRLKEVYARSELVVYCVSALYGSRPWPKVEYGAIRARQMRQDEASDPSSKFRLLPLRVGDGDVDGLDYNEIAPDVRNMSARRAAQLIVDRLRLLPNWKEFFDRPCVFLAHTHPDLDQPDQAISRRRLKAFLEELGWKVLPAAPAPDQSTPDDIKADMERCFAFVQLLSPLPWRPFDGLQHRIAEDLGLQRIRFRSADVSLADMDADHRAFVNAADVIVTGFEDFKKHLEQELKVLALHPRGADDADPPLVLVTLHAKEPELLWDKVFNWLYESERISLAQLGPEESIETRHNAERCQGFLVVCDGSTLTESAGQTRTDMEQVRLIQLREKVSAKRPPVGLVYWPPPEPRWSQFLAATPVKLHRIVGTDPHLDEFVSDVRRAFR